MTNKRLGIALFSLSAVSMIVAGTTLLYCRGSELLIGAHRGGALVAILLMFGVLAAMALHGWICVEGIWLLKGGEKRKDDSSPWPKSASGTPESLRGL